MQIGERTIDIKLWHLVVLFALMPILSATKTTLYISYFAVTLFISLKTFFGDNYVRHGRYPILSQSGAKNLFWCFGINGLFFVLGVWILIELNSWPNPLGKLQLLWGCYWVISFFLSMGSGLGLLVCKKE